MAETDRDRVSEALELRGRLRQFAATRRLADGALKPIEGGLSNLAWSVELDGERWFARLGNPQAARLGVDRVSECAVLHAVAMAGLAPEVLACEPVGGLLVTRFIDGPTWREGDAAIEANIRRFAERLRRLHQLPIPDGVHVVDYEQQAHRLAVGLPAPDALGRTLSRRAAQAFARIGSSRFPNALCHNDLHHLNLMDGGGRLWIVDWEYGGRGNPLFDLASFLALHDLGPAETRVLVDAYGLLQPEELEALGDACWAFDYVQWLWYRSRFPDPAGDEAWYADRLAQRLLRCNN